MTSDAHSQAAVVPLWLWMLVLAPFIGSFLGVVLRRDSAGRSWLWQRSACESCGTSLAARDLLPIVSFAVLRGRCRHCGSAISWFHPGIEVASLAVAFWAISAAHGAWLAASCGLGWVLVALTFSDLVSYRLPDILTLPLLVGGLIMIAVLMPAAMLDHALAAAVAYLGFRLIDEVYLRLRGQSGLGQGDAKLVAAAGAWLGLAALPYLILLAAVVALTVLLGLRLGGVAIHARSRLPFGPFLSLATWLLWLYASSDVFKLSPYLLPVLK